MIPASLTGLARLSSFAYRSNNTHILIVLGERFNRSHSLCVFVVLVKPGIVPPASLVVVPHSSLSKSFKLAIVTF